MNVDLIFQIAGVGIIVAVLNQLLTRAGRDDQALLTTIAGLVAVLFILSQQIGDLFDTVKNDDIIHELEEISINEITPMEALNILSRLQSKLKNRW